MKDFIRRGIIERYRKYLPVTKKTPVITLLEGDTPLLRARSIEKDFSLKARVFLKYEGTNPTGSFKDRGMTVAISKALEKKAKAVICASTGNTAASAAAYSAKAGIKCFVVIPEGAIALGKLTQALLHGAVVIGIRGNFDDALKIVLEIIENYPVELVNSLNPNRIEGQKTASFEIIDYLGNAPHYHFIPVGNAGNITAYWKGYKEFYERKFRENLKIKRRYPKMMGFQAKGAAPIVKGKVIKNPKTVATAIRIGNPASWKKAERARDESGGIIDVVSDKEIINVYKYLALKEGVFVEPASAASVAGLFKCIKEGIIKKNEKVDIVCTLTGHGLKDPDIAIKEGKGSFKVVSPSVKEVLRVMGL
ncbi:MAG: threonine synthase [Caldiserica bacterium]|nr:MAG: threonine synthase [Caldisericota bacterium]